MVSPLNSLTNMEYMLYGGASGVNPNCPSFTNGYMANRDSLQIPYRYNNQSIWNNQYPASGVGSTNTNSQATQASTQTNFNGSAKDMEILEKYYLKGLSPSESLLGVAGGGAAFAVVNNMRLLAHPVASLRALPDVEKMFAEVKKGGKLAELWTNPDTHKIMTDAYHKMHKLEGASKWRFTPLFKKRIDEKVYTQLKKEMELALKSGHIEQIAKATEKIRIATDAKTGLMPELWAKIRGKKVKTIAERIPCSSDLTKIARKKVTDSTSKSLSHKILQGFKSQGIKGGAFFAAMEFLMDFGKIKSAFSKDNKTGAKQLGQTSVKAAGSVIGWTVGEAVGAAAGAKIGAAVGTAVCPGLGTAIGAVAGLVGGSIGTWAMGKLTKAIVGEDVGSKVEAKKLAKTAEGQAQLLEITMQQAQEDLKKNKLDPKVAQALQNVIGQYNAVA